MDKIIEKLVKSKKPLTSSVVKDDFISASEKAFDCLFDGTSKYYPWCKPKKLPESFNIGVIVGASGSGKSTLLKDFGKEKKPKWDKKKSIISHFDSPDDGINKLSAVGLNTIPNWYKPYHVLSNGEKFRADLAMKLYDGAVIDEFTSVVDRNVAKAASVALSKYIKKNNIRNIVVATCHEDIIDWLEPDWVINTDSGEVYDGFFFVRPEINIEIYKANRNIWTMFKDHHYLSGNLHNATRCYVAIWDGNVVGFLASIAMPSGYLKNAWRGHRVVILPDFQGLGIGVKFIDAIAQIHIDDGKRFYSRGAHPRMLYSMEHSSLWKPTSKHKKLRTDVNHNNLFNNHYVDNKRVCGSFEYIGSQS